MPRTPSLDILHEDNHLLVINKRPLLATQGVAEGTPSLVTEVQHYLKVKYKKPGNVYVGVVSRLDAHTSGVVVLARTSKAASRLAEQFREQGVEKTYWAAVEAAPEPASGELVSWVVKDDKNRRMTIADRKLAGCQKAVLTYETLEQNKSAALVSVKLETGRKHQIRLQLADELSLPVIGDRKYGSRIEFPEGIALHARELAFDHPVGGKRLSFVAPLPATWKGLKFKAGK